MLKAHEKTLNFTRMFVFFVIDFIDFCGQARVGFVLGDWEEVILRVELVVSEIADAVEVHGNRDAEKIAENITEFVLLYSEGLLLEIHLVLGLVVGRR